MPRKFSTSFKESPSARSATKSNIAYSVSRRVTPFRKFKDIISFNLKGIKGKV